MSFDEDDFERTLWVGQECLVYKVRPRGPTGYVANDWKESDFIWKGRVRVTEQGEKCDIRLEEPNGQLFACCPVNDDQDKAVERVTDSSRYFVIRVVRGTQTAYLGMGFKERNDAFDFNVALEDHKKTVEHRRYQAAHPESAQQQDSFVPDKPTLQLGLKDGQTFKVNVNVKRAARDGTRTNTAGGIGLPPPPAAGRTRQATTTDLTGGGLFSSAPTPAPAQSFTSAPPQQQSAFGGFGAPAPAPAQSGFGGFGAAPAQQQQQGGFGAFGAAPAQSSGFPGFGAAPPAQQNNFGGFGAPPPQQQQPSGLAAFDSFLSSVPAAKPTAPISAPKPQQAAPAPAQPKNMNAFFDELVSGTQKPAQQQQQQQQPNVNSLNSFFN